MSVEKLWVYLIMVISVAACASPAALEAEYNLGFLAISVDTRGEINLKVQPGFSIPLPLGTLSVTGAYSPTQHFRSEGYTLVIHYNDEVEIYDLRGQEVNITFPPGYYDGIQILQRGTNIYVYIGSGSVTVPAPRSVGGGAAAPQNRPASNFSCPGAYGPSLTIGEGFYVPYGDGPTSVFTLPNTEPSLGRMPEGMEGTVINGPRCVQGRHGNLISWKVKADNGMEGWASEGYPDSNPKWIAPIN